MKPKVFIGSSTESLNIAYEVQVNLEYDAEVIVWTQGIFQLSNNTLEDLTTALNQCDVGIFVFSPDDITRMRDREVYSTRDNVVFELGLFIGRLGRSRSFFVLPRDVTDFHLPTDLAGIKPATFNAESENLRAALGPACHEIRQAIRRLGPLKRASSPIFYSHVKDAPQFSDLLRGAQDEVFASGASMPYVAQNLKNQLFDKARGGVSIKLLVMKYDEPLVRLIEKYWSISNFLSELNWCQETYRKWVEDASSEGLDIQIRVTPIVPIGLNIIDGKRDSGRLLVIPLPYHTAPAERPCILLDKSVSVEAFSLYHDRAVEWWESAEVL